MQKKYVMQKGKRKIKTKNDENKKSKKMKKTKLLYY